MAFMSAKNVLLDQHEDSREDILRKVSDYAAEIGITDDADGVYQGFLDREKIDKTGMNEGFAIPHCKADAVKEAAVIVFKNDHPVEWPSFDDKPVDIAMCLLVPNAEAGTTHLKLLSKTAVLLMRDGFKKLLREGTDAQAIADAINTELEK